MKKIGIYSGTFDPVHDGHLAFAREAAEQCGLDKVFFLVEPRPRRKQGVKALEHRLAMVQLAIRDEPKFGSIELQHQRFTATYTLPLLQARFAGAKLYMLMGDDWLAHFASWPHVEKLTNNLDFAIGVRHFDATDIKKRIATIQKIKGLKMRYHLFQAPKAAYASSSIRQAVKNDTTPAGADPKVLAYIKEQGLYASADTSSTRS